jgi:formylmethanofuran dehydrogenase subunit E
VYSKKLDDWPIVKTFFFKLKPKKEQDFDLLMNEVKLARTSIFGVQEVMINLDFTKSHRRGALGVCPMCGEGYPINDGEVCLGCQGKAPYS